MNRLINTPEETKQKIIEAIESYNKDPDKCDYCIHKDVCRYTESFKSVKSKIAKINGDLNSNIFIANVSCRYFYDESGFQNYNFISSSLDIQDKLAQTN